MRRSGGIVETEAAPSPGFFLAFSPEPEDPGNRKFTTARILKVVEAGNSQSAVTAQALCESVLEQTELVNSSRAAEMIKLLENIYRCVNIAESVPLTAEALRQYDGVLIATEHTACDYDFIVKESSLVADTRNAASQINHSREKIVRL